jgi:hypothetical protein
MPKYEMLGAINLGLEKLKKGDVRELTKFSGDALVEEGHAKEVSETKEETGGENEGGEGNDDATVKDPEGDQTEALKKALDSQYENADELREAAKAAGVEVAWNAGKDTIINKIVEQDKADQVLK